MRLTWFKASKNYENALADHLVDGAAAAGIEITIKTTEEYEGPEGDGAIIMGVVKREILWDHKAKNHPIILIDKGYCRDRISLNGSSVPAWWRMCWQDVHPTGYMMTKARPADRWLRMNMPLLERQKASPEGKVVILGSSAKFHQTMGLQSPTDWAQLIADSIHRRAPKNPIVYRPKPSWKYAEPVDGAAFDWGSKSKVADTLRGAWCAVTFGSIACVDAICAGVPCIVLGNAVAAPISSAWLTDVIDPIWLNLGQREQWAANLAYCNFTPTEIGDGTAWKILKETMSYAI